MKARAFATAAGLAVALFAGDAALAEPAASVTGTEPTAAVAVTPASSPAASSPFANANRTDDETLQQTRGGAGMTITTGDNGMVAGSSQDATSQNNTANNAITGSNNVADNAFQNSNGFVILNANTGNNVAINASMNVNIVTPR